MILGINALFSGSVDDANIANKAYDIFLPALTSFLSENVPHVPAPPDPQVYIGQFSALNNATTATIFVKDNEMYLFYNYSGQQQNVYLSYYSVGLMQV